MNFNINMFFHLYGTPFTPLVAQWLALHSRPVFRDGFLLAYTMWCWNSCWVGSALSFPVGFSSNSKKEAPIGVPGTSIRSVPTLTGEGINTQTIQNVKGGEQVKIVNSQGRYDIKIHPFWGCLGSFIIKFDYVLRKMANPTIYWPGFEFMLYHSES